VNGSIFNSKFGNFLFWKNLDSVYWPADGTIAHMHTKRYTVDPYIIHQPSKNFKQSLRGRLFVTDNKNDKQQSSLAYLLFGEYQAQLTKEWGNNIKLTTSAGGSHTNTSIKSEGFYGFHQGSNSAIFAQFDAKLYKTNISVGLREEYNRIDSIRAQGFPVIRAGFSQQFFKATYLRGSYGTGYRFPSVAERFTTTNAGGIVVAPNPSLLTETGKSSEIGLKQGLKFGKWTGYADAALFWTRYNYLIDFVFDNNLFAFQSKNLGNAKISGTEFTLAGTGKIGKVQTWLTSGYTFINPRYADTLIQPTLWDSIPYNNYLKYRFRHTWKVNIDAEYKNINIGATLRYNSYMLNMDPTLYFIVPGTYEYRTTHAHGYYILDLRASYIYKKNHRLSFIVKNSLNTEYLIVVGNMGAPRSFVLQYNLTL
jgi:iron complex outermembrane receptor protein